MSKWGLKLELDGGRGGLSASPLPWIWFEAPPVLLHVKTASAFLLRNGLRSSLGCFQMNYYYVMDKKNKKAAFADFVVTKKSVKTEIKILYKTF